MGHDNQGFEPSEPNDADRAGDSDEGGGRGKSTIKFPYGDLGDALTAVEPLFEHFGGSDAEPGQLAPLMNTTVSSSSFRTKLSTARSFGLIASGRKRLTLTPLGQRIVHPEHGAQARVDAFLGVPLYSRLYEQFKDNLPGNSGLEQAMVNLGVSAGSVDRARQAFQRSAQIAGFFAFGPNRLVKPIIKPGADGGEEGEEGGGNDDSGGSGRTPGTLGVFDGMAEHPLLVGLWKMVPDPDGGTRWDVTARRQWLRAVAINLDLLFSDGSQTVTPQNEVDVIGVDPIPDEPRTA